MKAAREDLSSVSRALPCALWPLLPYGSRVSFVRYASHPAAVALLVLGCGGTETRPPAAPRDAPPGVNIEIAELEISGSGADRFANCPPPGELGQDWIPPLAPWTPPSATTANEAPGDPIAVDDVTMHGATPTERAIADTRDGFRACWHHSLIYDPTQDGRVAIVLRVGADGRVVAVESYGACGISGEAVECMKASAKKLRFRRPEGGSESFTLPAVFTSANAALRTSPGKSDVYTASAYVALESFRPALHACEESARRSGRPVVASATFSLAVDAHGRVTHSNVDPWAGDKDLLVCAAAAFEAGSFPAPPGGQGTILARVAFNPRAGSK